MIQIPPGTIPLVTLTLDILFQFYLLFFLERQMGLDQHTSRRFHWLVRLMSLLNGYALYRQYVTFANGIAKGVGVPFP